MPSLFKSIPCADSGGPKVMLCDGSQDKLLKIIMRLFERVVDLSKPFNITLIGLAFSKFQQRKVGSSSIANFLIKKADLEVQSITSLTNTDVNLDSTQGLISAQVPNNDSDAFRSSPTTFQPSDQFYRRRTTAASPIPMLVDNGSESGATNSDFSDFSETEVEPSPKKSRISRLIMSKRRCFGSSAIYNSDNTTDVASPSKLRVCDLRLNSRDSDKDRDITSGPSYPISTSSLNQPALSPTLPTSDNAISTNLPPTSNENQLDDFRANALIFARQHSTKAQPHVTSMEDIIDSEQSGYNEPKTNSPTPTTNINGSLANIPCPAGVDPQVFNELPVEVQNELIVSWRNSLAAAAAAVANGSKSSLTSTPTGENSSQTQTTNGTTKAGGGVTSNGAQKNTLYRYFLRNK